MRCILNVDDSSCDGCRRRGSQCISQEFLADAKDGIVHGGKTSTTLSENSTRTSHSNDFPTPVSLISDHPASVDFYAPSKARIGIPNALNYLLIISLGPQGRE
jgi:hypothetical protein